MFKPVTFAFAILALVFAAVPAFAQTAQGTGTATAQGNGRAQVRCANCIVDVSGNGVLAILSQDGTVEVEISGEGRSEERETEWGTVKIYRGFNGTATITGEYFSVSLRGNDIDLFAEGTGRIWLRGNGDYTVNGQTGAWEENGAVIDLQEPVE